MADDLRSPLDRLNALDHDERAAVVAGLPEDELAAILAAADIAARPGQIAPAGDWTTWLILAGRGFGKTFAGAAWIDERARSVKGARLAVVGATLGDARSVMVEGDAGILAVARERPQFEPSRRLLTWGNGSTATLFGAAEPDSLRGPSFHFAWGDEIAKWDAAEDALANLAMTLRLGRQPRRVLTTTPRPLPWLQALAAPAPGVMVTRGRMVDNRANLSAAFIQAMLRDHGGTRLGRQELLGEFVVDLDGALWTRALLDRGRVRDAPAARPDGDRRRSAGGRGRQGRCVRHRRRPPGRRRARLCHRRPDGPRPVAVRLGRAPSSPRRPTMPPTASSPRSTTAGRWSFRPSTPSTLSCRSAR